MWHHDPDLEAAARHALEEAVDAVARPDATASDAGDVLEAAGTLEAMGCDPVVGGSVIGLVRAHLADFECAELDEATAQVLVDSPRCATLDPEVIEEEFDDLLDALRVRDRVELLWLGAERLGLDGAFPAEFEAARAAFDECVKPELWQLVPLGSRRSAEAAWIRPTLRPRFWWRTRGSTLPADALVDPVLAERVVAIFPEARAFLRVPDRPDVLWATLPEPLRARAKPLPLDVAAASSGGAIRAEWSLHDVETGADIGCDVRLETVPGSPDRLRIRVLASRSDAPRLDLVVHRGAVYPLERLPDGSAVAQCAREELDENYPLGLALRDDRAHWYVGLPRNVAS